MDITALIERRQAEITAKQTDHGKTDRSRNDENRQGFKELFDEYFKLDEPKDKLTAGEQEQNALSRPALTDSSDKSEVSKQGVSGTEIKLVDPNAPEQKAGEKLAKQAKERQDSGIIGRFAPGDDMPAGGVVLAPQMEQQSALKGSAQVQKTQTVSQPVQPMPQKPVPQSDPKMGTASYTEKPAPLVSKPGAALGTESARLLAEASRIESVGPAGQIRPVTPLMPAEMRLAAQMTGAEQEKGQGKAQFGQLAGQFAAKPGVPTAGNGSVYGPSQDPNQGNRGLASRAAVSMPSSSAPAPAPAPAPAMTGGGAAGTQQAPAPTRPTASQPQPQHARHAPATQPVADQVAVQLQRAVKAGIDRLTIQLKPATLGRIDISMDIAADGRVQAVVQADNSDTLQMLMRDHRELERVLQQANLQLDQGSLKFQLQGEQKQYTADGRELPSQGISDDDAREAVETAQNYEVESEEIDEDRIDLRV